MPVFTRFCATVESNMRKPLRWLDALAILGSLAVWAAVPLVTAPAAASALIDPGPFGPDRVTLGDGRIIDISPETHALYRMLTQTGRIHGRRTARPSEADARAGIELRRQHEPRWTTLFGERSRTSESGYVLPLEHASLPVRSGYKPGHRAEDIFASPGRRVFAPATMLILHAGYLSKTAGETVVGFVPTGRDQYRPRYFVFVHIDPTPARARVGEVVEAGTVVGQVASGDEAVVGNALGRLPHLHFVINEERPDGHLEGIPVWNLLRRLIGVTAQQPHARRHTT
jgi:peptidase M23-like protein